MVVSPNYHVELTLNKPMSDKNWLSMNFALILQGSSTSFAIKRKDELERVAKSNR